MMADVVKIATRDSYGNAVTALAAEHDDILVLDADLAGGHQNGRSSRRPIPTATSTAALPRRTSSA